MSRKGGTSPERTTAPVQRWVSTKRIPARPATTVIAAPKGAELIAVEMAKPPYGDPELVFVGEVAPIEAPQECWVVTTLRADSPTTAELSTYVGSWVHGGYRVFCFVRGPYADEREATGQPAEEPSEAVSS